LQDTHVLNTFHQAFRRTCKMVGTWDNEPFRWQEHGFVGRQRFNAKPPHEHGSSRRHFADVLVLDFQD